MDYTHIVLSGWMIDNAMDYFINQFFEAKEKGINSKTFYTECFEIILRLEEDIEYQYASKKAEITDVMREMNCGLISISDKYKPELSYEDKRDSLNIEYNEELAAVKRHNFVVDVSKYSSTKEKYWYLNMDLTYDEILLLKRNLNKAKEIIEMRQSGEDSIQSEKIPRLSQSKTQVDIRTTKKNEVENSLNFMLNMDPRKHIPILSEKDYDSLIKWVTYYFENGLELPEIELPIKRVNTSKGNVIYSFITLFDELHPEMNRPDSLFELIIKCFFNYRNDKISNLRKSTKKPKNYDDLLNNK